MFDKADSRAAAARALYKKYADRSVRHQPVFVKGDYVFLSRPPHEAKTAQEKAEDLAQSKLRFKTLGPFEVIDASVETVTILRDGLHLTVSIDRCVRDPGPADKLNGDKQQPEQDHVSNPTRITGQLSYESLHSSGRDGQQPFADRHNSTEITNGNSHASGNHPINLCKNGTRPVRNLRLNSNENNGLR